MNIFDLIVVQPIFNLLMVIYSVVPGGDFGVGVIVFTVIIRLILWPLVKKQLYQARAMRKMQPELLAINKKFKKDRQARALATMELYKKHNISMFGSIGVMLVQLPVLIAIYRVVQLFVSERGQLANYTYDAVEQWPAVAALLANPDNFNQNLLGVMDLTKAAVSQHGVVIGLVALALIAAVLQYMLSKQMAPTSSDRRLRDVLHEASQGKEADQAELNAIVMRKMMKFMPIMLFMVMISLPGALALYMAIGNIAAYVQNAIIIRQLDADESLQPKRAKVSSNKVASRAAKATEARITKIKAKG